MIVKDNLIYSNELIILSEIKIEINRRKNN